MKLVEIGKTISQPGGFKAFIPNSFPPKTGFDFDNNIIEKNAEASRVLGKLDGITKLLPDLDFFLLMYIRKDSASSSQIEGTKATMINAIEAENNLNKDIPDDVDDILHYIKALNYGIKRISEDNFPITIRLIKELHQQLMKNARTTHFSDPGEFRKSQNWIGGTRPDNAKFVPPPIDAMNKSLGDLELFINTKDSIPAIIKAGLIHSQFETLHPFLDGNGRTGRMLITLYLWKIGLLDKPVLFLSSYFKKHQDIYYYKLSGYHFGNVSEWIDFFLDGVIEIGNEATEIVSKISYLRQNNLEKIKTLGKRASESAIQILPKLYSQPIVNNVIIQKWTSFSRPGAQKVIDRFIEIGILSPRDINKKYDQVYEYKEYLDIFVGND
jgi:Fic family protein